MSGGTERGEVMPGIGILCSRETERERISYMLRLLLAQYGLACPLETVQSQGNWERYFCLVLSWEDAEQAFALAEEIWEAAPSMQIIYVARKVGDIFAALKRPFFHTVRSFDMEADLGAAVRKLKYFKIPLSERIIFSGNGRKLTVPRRELLYLESRHHSVCLHLQHRSDLEERREEVAETLTQCEEKLKGLGFVRIHRSVLVNMYHIGSLEKDSLVLLNGERLYISRHRMQEVRFAFDNYIRHLDFM